MRRIILLFLITLLLSSCNSNVNESIGWKADSICFNSDGEMVTSELSYPFSMTISIANVEHYGKTIFSLTKRDFEKEINFEYYYVLENDSLFECEEPWEYIGYGKKYKNPTWKEGILKTKQDADYTWKENGNKAELISTRDGTIFKCSKPKPIESEYTREWK
jgi:hypothetical protein